MPLVSVLYNDGNNVFEGSFKLNAILLSGLEVTKPPNKIKYFEDEEISYAGMVVTATFSDSTTEVVTDKCTISPPEGAAFDDTYVEITYAEGKNEKSCSLTLTPVTLSRIEVTTPPNKTKYFEGEPISYAGLTVTAYYSDDTTQDITDKCTITPPEGKAFDDDSYVEISYGLYSCSLTLENAGLSSLIQITTPPNKTLYIDGESVDYKGIVVSAVYDDGTQHDVTAYCDFEPAQGSTITSGTNNALIKCAPPVVPYVFDQNNGYVGIDGSEWCYSTSTGTFSDIYKAKAKHTYMLALGAITGNRFRAMFTTEDVSKAKNDVDGIAMIVRDDPDAYENTIFTPSTDGYIVIAKTNDRVSGLKSYLYDTTTDEKTEVTVQPLTVKSLVRLEITTAPKTLYITGDRITYEGLRVTAIFSDGTELDVTELCAITPKEKKAFDPATDTDINITFADMTVSLPLTENRLESIEITSEPKRKRYKANDVINYAGMVISGIYSDNSKIDITKLCSITPPEGKIFDPATDTTVTITYTDFSASMELEEDTSTSLTLQITSMPNKMAYKSEETLDYTGLTVMALYDNGTEVDVTEQCTITPAAGEPFAKYVDIAYGEAHTTLELTEIYVKRLTLIPPSRLAYKEGEQLDYAGLSVTAEYSNNTTADVTDQCFYSHEAGEAFDPINNYVWIYYKDAYTHFVLKPLENSDSPIYVAQNPKKMSYEAEETMDYYGIVVKMRLDDTELDVTDICDFNPPQGADYSGDTVLISCAPPLEPYLYDFAQGSIGRGAWFGGSGGDKIDIYKVQADITYTLLSGGTDAVFSTVDVSQITTTLKCEYIALNSSYTPTEDGYIVIDKGYGVSSGTKTYVYGGEKTETTTLKINVAPKISVIALPLKTLYYAHELIDYSGLIITYMHDDGTTEDITNTATISPAPGTAINSDVRGINISYNGIGIYEPRVELLLQCPRELKLILPPNKTLYEYGDAVDYTGIKINAVFTDGTETEVTNDCTFSPQSGTLTDKDTVIKATYMGLSLVLNNPIIKNISFISCVEHNNSMYPYLDINDSSARPIEYWDSDYYGRLVKRPIIDYHMNPVAKIFTYLQYMNPELGTVTIDTNYLDFACTSTDTVVDQYTHSSIYGYGRGEDVERIEEEDYTYFDWYVRHEQKSYDKDGRLIDSKTTRTKFLSDKRPSELEPYISTGGFGSWQSYIENPYIKGTDTPGITPQRAVFTYMGVDYEVPIQGIPEDAKITFSGYPSFPISYGAPIEVCTRKGAEKIRAFNGKLLETLRFYIANLYINDLKHSLFFRMELNKATITSHMVLKITAENQGLKYFIGEKLNVSVTAEYTDGTTADVSSMCILSPDTATSDYQTSVKYTSPTGETATTRFDYAIVVLRNLDITTPPNKVVYYEGDLFDATGIAITATFERDTDVTETRDVTSRATLDRTGNLITKNNGYFYASYTYRYTTKRSERFDLTVYDLIGITVTTHHGLKYRTGETMHYTNMSVLANYEDGTSQDVTSDVVCTPADGSVATPSATTVTVSYTKGNKTVTTSFEQTIIKLSYLEFTSSPHKTAYKVGERIDYSGIEIKAVFEDGHKTGVTGNCIYSLPDNAIITSTQIPTVSYTHNSGEVLMANVPITIASLDSLTVTDPIVYELGSTIDYSSVTVFANYSDETSEEVTSEVIYDIPDGGTVTKDTQRNITVTYNKADGVSITGVLALKIRIIKWLEITPPTKTSYDNGDALDFTGLKVICKYTDGTTADVTSSVSLSVEEGAVVDEDTSNEITITYTEGTETVTGQFEIEII